MEQRVVQRPAIEPERHPRNQHLPPESWGRPALKYPWNPPFPRGIWQDLLRLRKAKSSWPHRLCKYTVLLRRKDVYSCPIWSGSILRGRRHTHSVLHSRLRNNTVRGRLRLSRGDHWTELHPNRRNLHPLVLSGLRHNAAVPHKARQPASSVETGRQETACQGKSVLLRQCKNALCGEGYKGSTHSAETARSHTQRRGSSHLGCTITNAHCFQKPQRAAHAFCRHPEESQPDAGADEQNHLQNGAHFQLGEHHQ